MTDIKNQYLIFEVDEEYAICLENVDEIIRYTIDEEGSDGITKIPEAPEYISGVLNLRGHVLPIMNIRCRFKKPIIEDKEKIPRQCIIIAKIENSQLGLVVDNVIDLINIDEANLKDPPQVGSTYSHVFIKSIGIDNESKKMHLIIDTDRLIHHKDLAFVDDISDSEDTEKPLAD